jgi:hypothetical protein
MKTIVQNENNYSSYVFEDDTEVTISSDNIITPNFIISDLNSSNATMHENVTPPNDWVGNKYTFNGTTWAANPDWVDPTEEDEGGE